MVIIRMTDATSTNDQVERRVMERTSPTERDEEQRDATLRGDDWKLAC